LTWQELHLLEDHPNGCSNRFRVAGCLRPLWLCITVHTARQLARHVIPDAPVTTPTHGR